MQEIIGQYNGDLKGLFLAGAVVLVVLISLLAIIIEQKLLANKSNANISCQKTLSFVIKNSENPFLGINKILSDKGIIVANLQSNIPEGEEYIQVEMTIKTPEHLQNKDIEDMLTEEIKFKEIKCK